MDDKLKIVLTVIDDGKPEIGEQGFKRALIRVDVNEPISPDLLAGNILVAYIGEAKRFMAGHECEDCPAYALHEAIVDAYEEHIEDALNENR